MRKRSIPERVREGDTGHVGPTEEVGPKTRVKRRCGRTEYFEVKVGLHQGYVLSSLLIIIILSWMS